jgi:hypothetical protein
LAIFWAKYDENRGNFLSLKCGKDLEKCLCFHHILPQKRPKLDC